MKTLRIQKGKITGVFNIEVLFTMFIIFALLPDMFRINGISLKPMYAVLGVLCILLLRKRNCILPNKTVLIIFSYGILVSFGMMLFMGVGRRFFNYIFGIVVLTIFCTLGKSITFDRWMVLLQKVWGVCITVVTINDISNYKVFSEYFYLKLNHPALETVIVGGVNLEATWLGILSVFFWDKWWRFLPLGISSAFSLLYASRCGMIADILVAMFFVYEKIPFEKAIKRIKRIFAFTLLGIVGCAILLNSPSYSRDVLKIFSRITQIGRDVGSMGRIAMWKYAPNLIKTYPMGVGLGNCMKGLMKVSPILYEEDNMHCVILQMFCEIGVFGGIAYILVWGRFIKKNIYMVFKNPIIQALIIYFLLSFFQFGGGETIFFCILGIYFCTKKTDWREVRHSESKNFN